MATFSKFRSGKTGRTKVGSQTLTHKQWSTRYHGVRLGVENFESNGWNEGLIGFRGLDWTLGANWDATKNPLDDPPGLYPRDNGTSMQLYTSTSDDKSWSIPFWLCEESTISVDATGLVTFDAKGQSQGEVTPPTGSS